MKVTVLPEATREDMLREAHMPTGQRWHDIEKSFDPASAVQNFGSIDGWSIVMGRYGGEQTGGLTVHRGVLHPDEFVNVEMLRLEIEEHLGFSFDEVARAYPDTPGKPTPEALALREQIDARLLEIEDEGGNMRILARAFGWAEGANGHSRKMSRALARARKAAQ